MKFVIVILALAFSLQPSTLHAQLKTNKENEKEVRHIEKYGKFSYVPPKDWAMKELPVSKYKIAIGPVKEMFASNIVVDVTAYEGRHDIYIDGSKKLLAKSLMKYKLLKEEEFKSSSGIVGTRLIFESEQYGSMLRQNSYSLPTKKKVFTFTCTTIAEGGDKLDELFNTAALTFRVEE